MVTSECTISIDDAYIIDLDFASLEDKCYLKGYSDDYTVCERHPEAQANRPMKKIHDRYSLCYIMEFFFDFAIEAENIPLDLIASKIEKIFD